MKTALALAAVCIVQFLGGLRTEDKCRSGYFNIRPEHRLAGHVITRATVDSELSCAHKCLALDGCKSGNFRTSENKHENCELSSQGLQSQTHDPALIRDEEFVFISLKNESTLATVPAVPVKGGWSEWGNWGLCNASRTDEDRSPKYRQRTRNCTNPPPQNGGTECDRNSVETQLCCPSQPGLPGCFELFQLLPTTGAEVISTFEINSELFVVFASHYNDNHGYNTQTPVYRLQGTNFTLNQTLATTGTLDVEPFTINGDNFLAVANAQNGIRFDLNSVVYRWEGGKFHVFQLIPTNRCTDMHYFTVSNRKLLLINNHQNNVVSLYEWLNDSFSANIQVIEITGPRKCTTFVIVSDTYIACGSSSDISTVLKWNGTQFAIFQILPSSKVLGHPCSFEANRSVFLAFPSFESPSNVYRWNTTNFTLHQSIPTSKAYSVESFIANGDTFLAVSRYQTEPGTMVDVYKMTGNHFTLYQQIPATGATDLLSFTHMGRRYLAIANYKNNKNNYNIDSTVYIWT